MSTKTSKFLLNAKFDRRTIRKAIQKIRESNIPSKQEKTSYRSSGDTPMYFIKHPNTQPTTLDQPV